MSMKYLLPQIPFPRPDLRLLRQFLSLAGKLEANPIFCAWFVETQVRENITEFWPVMVVLDFSSEAFEED
jgi:hypothetical protein